jgi:hypothetical protein
VDQVEEAGGTLRLARFTTVSRNPGWWFWTGVNDFGPLAPQFFFKFPLFQSAYCYYWFYMFFI